MRLLILSIPLNVILVSLIAINFASSNHLSTLFVVETSDSDSLVSSDSNNDNNQAESAAPIRSTSSVSNAKLKKVDDSIIIDDSNAQTDNSDKRNQKNPSRAPQQPKSTVAQANQDHNNEKHTQENPQFNHNYNQQQQQRHHHDTTSSSIQERSLNDENTRHRDSVAAARRIEEESNLAPIVHKNNGGANQHQPAHRQVSQQKQQKSTTTTTSPYDSENNASIPKTEERLLISISSDEDEPHYQKNPHVGSSGSGGTDEPQSTSLSPQPNRNQKRKPAITISIQDANNNKQGSGSSAVIVRPSEDGHSIVIATVGSHNGQNSNNNNGNNKYKPTVTNSNDTPNSNSNQQPYREPVNNPIQSIVQQHQITSTTRRPTFANNDYSSPNNQNRPISSTLLDTHRPLPAQSTDERPQRPTQGNVDEQASGGYETPRPNNARPTSTSTPYSLGDDNDSASSSTNNQGYEPATNDQFVNSSVPKYPLNEKNCGIMHETRIVGGEEANPDNFMWMAAIIKSRPKDGDPRPFCGGSLITRRHVLTAAHCLDGLAPRDVLVRLGSYDFDDSASSASADFAIDQFRVPAQYSKKTHVADIAIMRLKTPLQPTDNYKSVCMPQPRRSYVGALGTVTGYGSKSQTFRRATPTLRQVTVPIWENRKCSVVYKRNLTESFLCAGYEEGGKDACQGDSGGPLMTEGPEQKMMVVGVVSHGIGCGSPGYPGVYTRVSTYIDWIEKNTKE